MFPGFDRHEILARHYAEKIRQWDWRGIVGGCELRPGETKHDDPELSNWLGTVTGLMPSGKYYTCWTSNQTPRDVAHDAAFRESLEEIAEEHGGFISDYDDSIYFAMHPEIKCDVWAERDRLHIRVYEEKSDTELLDLWDEDARQAIEDGFIEAGPDIEDSAIEYALERFNERNG